MMKTFHPNRLLPLILSITLAYPANAFGVVESGSSSDSASKSIDEPVGTVPAGEIRVTDKGVELVSSVARGSDKLDYAPDRIIIKFKQPKAQDLPTCINCIAARIGIATSDIQIHPLFKAFIPSWQMKAQSIPHVDSGSPQQTGGYGYQTTDADTSKPAPVTSEQPVPTQQQIQQAAQSALDRLKDIYVMQVPQNINIKDAVQKICEDPSVAYAHPDHIVHVASLTNDTYADPDQNGTWSTGAWGQSYADLWGLQKIDVEHAWNSTRGAGVVVAVVDTGLDTTHPDIAANVYTNTAEIPGNGIDDDHNGFIDDVSGWNFVSNTNNPVDDHGHGTHVSGTIAAVGNNNTGVVGIAYQAKIMPLKGLNAGGSGYISDLSTAVVYAADNGARVISNSWGGHGYDQSIVDAISYAHDVKDVVVVAAAGNSASDVGTENNGFTPADIRDVITVSAFDHKDAAAYFTNFGHKINVAAPGGGDSDPTSAYQPYRSILSLKSSQAGSAMTGNGLLVIGGNCLRQAGTSMACPHVSGVAALVRALRPTFSAEQVRQALEIGSDDVGTAGFDVYSGYGRLNAYKALQQAAPLEAQLTGPIGTVTGANSVDIKGNAKGPNFAGWRLEYGSGEVPTSWTQIATGNSPVSNNVFTTWNLSSVPDGTFIIRLRSFNTSGAAFQDRMKLKIDQIVITDPAPNWISTAWVFLSGDAISVRGSAAPSNFQSYTIQILHSNQSVYSGANVTLTNGGLSPVSNNELGKWNTAGTPADHYYIKLIVNLTNGSQATKVTRVIVDPTVHPGWPQPVEAITTPGYSNYALTDHLIAADINGDGKKDLIIGYGSKIKVIDHTGALLPGWPQTVDPTNSGTSLTQTTPAVGDLDGDGSPDIVAVTNSGRIFAWHGNGQLLPGFPITPGLSYIIGVSIDDIDGNGTQEMVVTDWNGTVTVLDKNGNTLPGWPRSFEQSASFRLMSRVAIGDMDGDGKKEIAVANMVSPQNLYVLRYDGTTAPGWPRAVSPASPSTVVFSWPAMGDLEGNGKMDVVIGSSNGKVCAYRYDGTFAPGWPQSTQAAMVRSPVIGDIDGDGRADVVAGNTTFIGSSGGYEAWLYAWHGNGSLFPGWPRHPTEWFQQPDGFEPVGLADVNDDGKAEIIVSGGAGINPFAMHAYQYDGTEAAGFPKPTRGTGAFETNSPVIADMDGNGRKQLAWIEFYYKGPFEKLTIGYAVNMWDLTAPSTAYAPWPMFHHDASLTGRYTALPVPPAAPSNLTATAISSNQINLAWTDNSNNESGFKIERSPTGTLGSFTQIATIGANVTSYSNTGLSASTTYYYRVRAYNGGGDSGSSNVASATTPLPPPMAPSDLTATAVSTSQINLSWKDNSSSETGFKIERSTDNVNFSQIATVGANVTSYSNTGLSASTTYYYRVCAYNAGGNSAYSNTASAATFEEPPAAPSNFTATAASAPSYTVRFTWTDNSNNESGFEVQSSQHNANIWSTIVRASRNATAASYDYSQNISFVEGTTIDFRVVAVNSGGSSASSNVVSLIIPPRVPSNLRATAVSSSQIDLSWKDNSNIESGFKIERSTDGRNFTQIATVDANVTSYSDTGLSASTTYYYRICAYSTDGGNSAYEGTASATTLSGPPAAPTNFTAVPDQKDPSTVLNFTWTDNSSSETGFRVQYSQHNANNWYDLLGTSPNVTSASYDYSQNTGLAEGSTIDFRVIAVYAGGFISPSNVVSLIIPPHAPTNLTATAISSSQINLSWKDNSSSETGFKIERGSSSSGPFSQIATVGANATSYSNTGLNASTTYYYRVCAYNDGGNSTYSGTASATTFSGPPVPPAAPSNLTATAISSSQINLAWTDNSNNESGFKIERSLTGASGSFSQITTVGANVTSYSDTGLTEGTTYSYRVRAYNATGNSAYSNTASATTPPAAPTILTATAVSSSEIDLSWKDNSSIETGFKIERSTDNVSFTQIATVGTNVVSYSDTGLASSTTYYYRVRAYNNDGNSTYSNTASAKTSSDNQPPPPPTWVEVYAAGGAVGDGGPWVQVQWKKVKKSPLPDGYIVHLHKGDPNGEEPKYFPFTSRGNRGDYGAVGSGSLIDNTRYYAQVFSYKLDAQGNPTILSDPTNADTYPYITPKRPTDPINVSAAAVSSTKVKVSWEDTCDYSNIHWVLSCDADGKFDPSSNDYYQTSGTATSYTVTKLKPGKTYYYLVIADNNRAESNKVPKPPASATTLGS